MKEQLDRLESKVDKTIDAVAEIGITMAKMEIHVEQNTDDLHTHIKRTDLAEARLDRLERIDQWIRGAVWMLAGLSAIAYSVLKLLK